MHAGIRSKQAKLIFILVNPICFGVGLKLVSGQPRNGEGRGRIRIRAPSFETLLWDTIVRYNGIMTTNVH